MTVQTGEADRIRWWRIEYRSRGVDPALVGAHVEAINQELIEDAPDPRTAAKWQLMFETEEAAQTEVDRLNGDDLQGMYIHWVSEVLVLPLNRGPRA